MKHKNLRFVCIDRERERIRELVGAWIEIYLREKIKNLRKIVCREREDKRVGAWTEMYWREKQKILWEVVCQKTAVRAWIEMYWREKFKNLREVLCSDWKNKSLSYGFE